MNNLNLLALGTDFSICVWLLLRGADVLHDDAHWGSVAIQLLPSFEHWNQGGRDAGTDTGLDQIVQYRLFFRQRDPDKVRRPLQVGICEAPSIGALQAGLRSPLNVLCRLILYGFLFCWCGIAVDVPQQLPRPRLPNFDAVFDPLQRLTDQGVIGADTGFVLGQQGTQVVHADPVGLLAQQRFDFLAITSEVRTNAALQAGAGAEIHLQITADTCHESFCRQPLDGRTDNPNVAAQFQAADVLEQLRDRHAAPGMDQELSVQFGVHAMYCWMPACNILVPWEIIPLER
ncbi:hypothetical protein [Deinococcus proteolyticus]|uniref:hypothetical protein n=1 Tax=Deinococcus proteolyticus TaxID=55148 RepID=UPI00059CFA25|nr:hypothetical protein [Deinococcus proteolyticus]